MRRSVLWLASSLLLPACAPTAHQRFGDVAHYAPSHAAYVVGEGDDLVVLRDPITTEKIRCREDLARFAPAVADALEDDARDRHARRASAIGMGPFTAVGVGVRLAGDGLLFPLFQLDTLFASSQPRSVYIRARDAYVAGRFAEARDLFLILVVNQGHGDSQIENLPRAWVDLSLYYFAVSSEATQRPDDAKVALRRFLAVSTTEGELLYRDAETRLARLEGKPAPACASRADLTLTWRRPQ
ncbi:Hypothetical protein A7982_11517 [Minicystis rosea]|nr:Hypothetical protein A7982_11517 [Minicystis rosea]